MQSGPGDDQVDPTPLVGLSDVGLPTPMAPQQAQDDGRSSAQLFISYSHSDTDAAALLVKRLKALGWTVTWDKDLKPGCDSPAEIRDRINSAERVLVLWSNKGAGPWTSHEATLSAEKIFPIRIDKVDPPAPYTNRHYINLLSIRSGRINRDELRNLTDHLPAPANPQTYGARNMGSPPHPFVGRDKDVEQLVDTLTRTPPQSVVVRGGVFVGKTGLCETVFEDLRVIESYDFERYYVDLKNAHSCEKMFNLIANILQLPAKTKNSGRMRPDAVQRLGDVGAAIIDYLYQQHTLLVLDNFEMPFLENAKKSELFLHLIEKTKISAYLVAVRSEGGPSAEALQHRLLPLDKEDVRNLFMRLTGFTGRHFEKEVEELDKLLWRVTGGLPFWVRLRAKAALPAYNAIVARGRVGTKCGVLAQRFEGLSQEDGELALANAIDTPLLEQQSKRLLYLLGCVPDGLSKQDIGKLGLLLEDFNSVFALQRLSDSGLAEWTVDDDRIFLPFPVWKYIRGQLPPPPSDLYVLGGYFLALAYFGNAIDFGNLGNLITKLRIEFGNIAEVLLRIIGSDVATDRLADSFARARKLIQPESASVDLQAPDEIAILAAIALARFQQFSGYAGSFVRNTEALAAALKIAQSWNRPLRIAECHRLFGAIRQSEGDLSKALQSFNHALQIYEALSGPERIVGIAHCIRNKAVTEMKRNSLTTARELFNNAKEHYIEVKNIPNNDNLPSVGYGGTIFRKDEIIKGMAVCEERLAWLDKADHDQESAGKRYSIALNEFKQINDILGQATCYKGFADLDCDLIIGNLARASKRYDLAQEYFRQVGYLLGEADCLYSRADLSLKQAIKAANKHDDDEVLSYCREARAGYVQAQRAYEGLRNRHGIAITMSSIVDIDLAMRVTDESTLSRLEADIQTALEIFGQTQDNDNVAYANCYQARADICSQRACQSEIIRARAQAEKHWLKAFSPTPIDNMYTRSSFSPIGAMSQRWRK